MPEITKSRAKLAEFEEQRKRDRRAFEIMRERGCSFSEAYAIVLDAMEGAASRTSDMDGIACREGE